MKILLTGRNGQVGFELAKVLEGDLVATDRGTLDLEKNFDKAVRDLKPDVIVNAAAYTAVDLAESQQDKAERVNGAAPGILAGEAKRLGALLVHYSTDYVFDGAKGAPYAESDAPHPLNAYGRTKLEGEKRIAASGCRHLILRTSWVYAPRGRNFFLAIANKARAGESLRVVSDQYGVPTEARFIAETTRELVKGGHEGVFNVVPSGDTTWHGFARAIVDRLHLKVPVTAIPSGEYPTPARRPAYSILSTEKISRTLRKPPPAWETLLDRCVKAWTSA